MPTSETKNRIQASRDVLVGKLPLPTDLAVHIYDTLKIQRVLARIWGTTTAESPNCPTLA